MNIEPSNLLSRRAALTNMGVGLGSIAVQSLLAESTIPNLKPHFAPKAKQVIFLFAGGGVSQLDLFDPKPELIKRHGQFPPDELLKGERFAFIKPKSKLMRPHWSFKKYGQSGMDFSELLPYLATVADKTTLVRSVKTNNVNHTPAQTMMGSGFEHPGRPAIGGPPAYPPQPADLWWIRDDK